MESIKITDLTKKYGAITAVDGINLTINEGEIFGLLGPNGAGKTTILMMLSTLLKPTSGLAIVNGFNVATHPDEVRASIGMVFQDPSSDTLLTGYENLKLHALMYNLPWKDIDKKIESVLELVDLRKRKRDIVKKYSGGMRRRLEIARGLLHEPKIFFLDEPTLGLDPQTRHHIWEYIRTLANKIKMTIIVTTHYMEEAEKLCSRIGIVDHGKIVALDSPSNLIRSTGGDIVSLKGRDLKLKDVEKLPFVKGIKQAEGRYLVVVENSGKNLQELLSVTGEVEFVEVHSPDLNDVFLFYTGREMREGGEEVGFMQDAMRIT
ncbi:MAG: ATP-binding cassette domain-containing protein [Candidatus Firestonebacteria bacterium]